jgi:hypothetical protein
MLTGIEQKLSWAPALPMSASSAQEILAQSAKPEAEQVSFCARRAWLIGTNLWEQRFT